ncbi:MAG: cytochrome c [Anaerolineae bacterium]|jgi:mono/diheme cytochrome c family protein|nr:cytochrome c [Anaerolineae bacterium]MBT4309625.1 cytochrome c [Anaerolineae bacterium]MBT4456988.1 cytochrome c [Anaerolineae bacterium]MBT4843226.1 cytochrome c [Anaerolineae bacterium]MBT6060653.1 cytochrome c [Anaerolineae bacterium]
MNKRLRLIFFGVIVVAVGGILFWQKQATLKSEAVTINGITVPPVPVLDAEEIAQGKVTYNQYCVSCHGADLEGVPNWKISQPDGTLLPPPHDSNGHTWHHPDTLLLQIISDGGLPENGNMPAFSETLSEEDIYAVLAFIKTSWGAEERDFQWWISTTQNSFYE